jgi:hypothetical protein
MGSHTCRTSLFSTLKSDSTCHYGGDNQLYKSGDGVYVHHKFYESAISKRVKESKHFKSFLPGGLCRKVNFVYC